MKLLICVVIIMSLLVAPLYQCIKAYNKKVSAQYQMPVSKMTAGSIGLAIVVAYLLGVEFEGAAISWLVHIFVYSALSVVLGTLLHGLVRYFKGPSQFK